MNEDIPPLPGYISVKEAAEVLGISERRVYTYIEMKRLSAVRAADVLLLSVDEVQRFKRHMVGRPRQTTPPWRISSEGNTQFMTSLLVQVRPGQHKTLLQRLTDMKQQDQHTFPGTVARYIAASQSQPESLEVIFIWRQTVMPDDTKRAQLLDAFRQQFDDILDWQTVQERHGPIYLHT